MTHTTGVNTYIYKRHDSYTCCWRSLATRPATGVSFETWLISYDSLVVGHDSLVVGHDSYIWCYSTYPSAAFQPIFIYMSDVSYRYTSHVSYIYTSHVSYVYMSDVSYTYIYIYILMTNTWIPVPFSRDSTRRRASTAKCQSRCASVSRSLLIYYGSLFDMQRVSFDVEYRRIRDTPHCESSCFQTTHRIQQQARVAVVK